MKLSGLLQANVSSYAWSPETVAGGLSRFLSSVPLI